MYIQPKRIYLNSKTGKFSDRIADVIGDSATLIPSFSCGVRRGTWFGSPFKEVETVKPMLPRELARFKQVDESYTWAEAMPVLFKAVCDSIKRSWKTDKMHVVFCSSGNDSRIITAAIRKLMLERRPPWIGQGVILVSNRWEAREFLQLAKAQGWPAEWCFPYQVGPPEDHFRDALDFESFWYKTNAPIPLPGNLWYYLIEWLQFYGVAPGDEDIQVYSGLWANETWHLICQGGLDIWRSRFESRYYYNVLAALPFKTQTEFPLSDTDVLRVLPAIKRGNGDRLRMALADYACPEAKDIPRLTLDDRGHPISEKVRDYCRAAYFGSWYGKQDRRWEAPKTSEFCTAWARYGLASLCDHLRKRGCNVR